MQLPLKNLSALQSQDPEDIINGLTFEIQVKVLLNYYCHLRVSDAPVNAIHFITSSFQSAGWYVEEYIRHDGDLYVCIGFEDHVKHEIETNGLKPNKKSIWSKLFRKDVL